MSHSKKNLDPLKVKKLSSFQENLGLFQRKKKFIIKVLRKTLTPLELRKLNIKGVKKTLLFYKNLN